MATNRSKNGVMKRYAWLFVGLFVLLCVILVSQISNQSTYVSSDISTSSAPLVSNVVASNSNPTTSGPEVIIDGTDISVDLSTTTAEIDQGLSGRPTLGALDGMFFVFNSAKLYRFWMPDMNFPLDMIWIGSDMKVVDISKDVPTTFDPAHPIFYSPKIPAQYVLEVNAGFSDAHNIAPGDSVNFSSI